MKALIATLAVLLAFAGPAQADENSVMFNQATTADGQVRIDITVTYVFPGQPPRQGNYGLGFTRITLPESKLTLDPTNPPDNGYNCFVSDIKVECANEGQPSGTGTTFPTSVTLHLLSASCYAPSDPTGAQAEVWSAPNDPGSAPDVTLPMSPGSDCGGGVDQPVLEGHGAKCVVPKLAGSTLASARRQVRNAHCKVGKITFAKSKKVKKGRVISQSLKPKKTYPANTKVNFVVAK